MAKRNLRVGIILDRSGSMNSCREVTIEAVNEYTESLKADKNLKGRLTLTLFDSESIDTLWDRVKISECPKLSAETYMPRSATPLYDAVGKTVCGLDTENTDKYDGVALVIVTDGHENSSQEYSKESIKKLLDGKQEHDGWLVLYLGANQDAFAEGAQIGAQSGQTMNYAVVNTAAAFSGAAAATTRYVSAPTRGEGIETSTFTENERESASSE